VYFAAWLGSFRVLHYLVEEAKVSWSGCDGLCARAATVGDLQTLAYLKAYGCPWNANTDVTAAASGHIHILEWIRDQGYAWTVATAAAAARGGHLECLQWLREQVPPCPWDGRTVSAAFSADHPEVAEWALTNGCPDAGDDYWAKEDGDWAEEDDAVEGEDEEEEWADADDDEAEEP
jgi:hypothetical protein